MANNLISRITVLGKATATTYQVDTDPGVPVVLETVNNITADTDNLEPGMQIIFLDDFGGLVAEQEYYILSEGFSSTNFRVSTTKGGTSTTLTDDSGIVSFVAARVFDGTGPGILLDTNTNNPAQIDYTDRVNKIEQYLGRIADSLETSDSTRLADNIQTYISAGTGEGDGIKHMNVYDWVMLASMYKLYVDDDTDYRIGLEELLSYITKVRDLPKL